jgi:hypothetical protein
LYVELFALGCRAIFGQPLSHHFLRTSVKTDFTAATTETSLSSSFFYNENDPLHFKGKPYRDLLKGAIMTNSKKLRLNSSHGLKLIVIILLLAYSIDAPVQAQNASHPPRDWATYPAVVEVDNPPGDIFAVSDPHAHDLRMSYLLQGAGLLGLSISINDSGGGTSSTSYDWVGGNAVLVVVGDMIDKLPTGSLEVINLLRALQKDAARKGGRVIVTMGNHEAEFLAEDGCPDPNKKCKTADFVRELKAAGMNPQDVAQCKGDLGQWLCQLPVAAHVGDWFFAHAGYTNNRNIPTINSDIAADFALNGFKADQLVGDQSILEAGLDESGPKDSDGKGLPWVFNGNKNTKPEDTLKQFTQTLGVRHIVQGHKPGNVNFKNGLRRERGDVFHAYGLLFLIDTDMGTSTGDSKDAVLRIHNTRTPMPPQPNCYWITTHATVIKKDGSQKQLWQALQGNSCL